MYTFLTEFARLIESGHHPLPQQKKNVARERHQRYRTRLAHIMDPAKHYVELAKWLGTRPWNSTYPWNKLFQFLKELSPESIKWNSPLKVKSMSRGGSLFSLSLLVAIVSLTLRGEIHLMLDPGMCGFGRNFIHRVVEITVLFIAPRFLVLFYGRTGHRSNRPKMPKRGDALIFYSLCVSSTLGPLHLIREVLVLKKVT